MRAEILGNLTSTETCGCLMLTASLSKVEKSIKMPMAFLVIFSTIFTVLILLLFPVWQLEYDYLICDTLGMMTVFFWIVAQFTDPG